MSKADNFKERIKVSNYRIKETKEAIAESKERVFETQKIIKKERGGER